jgi:hypothetical protein
MVQRHACDSLLELQEQVQSSKAERVSGIEKTFDEELGQAENEIKKLQEEKTDMMGTKKRIQEWKKGEEMIAC